MTKPTRLSVEIQTLLLPRKSLPWADVKGFMAPWAKQVIIENEASRAFLSSIIDQEQEERSIIQDQVEGAIIGLASKPARFWMSEYTFIAKILTIDQLIPYAPAFVKLAYSMPIKLVSARRLVVRKYLMSIFSHANNFLLRQQRKFCRSSVLFYPFRFQKGKNHHDLLSKTPLPRTGSSYSLRGSLHRAYKNETPTRTLTVRMLEGL